MSETEPIIFRPRPAGAPRYSAAAATSGRDASAFIAFDRQELRAILDVYGTKVSSGEWRDYAIDIGREKAVFSVFRRSSEIPLYRIEKNPKLARKQGAYSIVAATGLILKRGHDLARVLGVLSGIRLVDW